MGSFLELRDKSGLSDIDPADASRVSAAGSFLWTPEGGAPWLCLHSITQTSVGLISKTQGNSGQPKHLEGVLRGEITSFSLDAVKRMRNWIIRKNVPGAQMVETTFTIPGEVTPKEWREGLKKLTNKFNSRGVSVVWRVELQKRKQPHFHILGFAKTAEGIASLVLPHVWLSCLPKRCQRHRGARAHAIKSTLRVTDEDVRWLAYCVGHGSKKKLCQLGWIGKQWGIIGRKNFVDRPCIEVQQNDEENRLYRRTLLRWKRTKAKKVNRRKVRLPSSFIMPAAVSQKLLLWIEEEFAQTKIEARLDQEMLSVGPAWLPDSSEFNTPTS